jgi:hypothetical protein
MHYRLRKGPNRRDAMKRSKQMQAYSRSMSSVTGVVYTKTGAEVYELDARVMCGGRQL